MTECFNKICIVAVGYNRPDAMKRLLTSLENAIYDEEVDILISIDKGARQNEIVEVAEKFDWEYGEKNIRAFTERQGLRNHIIQCGDVSKNYRAVIILEDDITVSEGFYSYTKQCLDQYEFDDNISGISLYKCEILQTGHHFFEPAFDGHDVFLMQYAQSWGQCWTEKMWDGFKEWYLNNVDTYFLPENKSLIKIPDNVINWDSHSWLKYYIAYTVETNKYFVYPYHSLTTNHSESGQHCSNTNSSYMVSMQDGTMEYRFPDWDDSIRYDVFFERIGLNIPDYKDKRVILDLYGNKKDFSGADILFSSASRPYKVIETLQLKYRPQEYNCIFRENGQGIYVYDLSVPAECPKSFDDKIRTLYEVKNLSWKRLLRVGLDGINNAIKRRIKK